MTLKLNDYGRIAVNSATDPGVLFNLGNVAVSMQDSWEAAAINGGVALMSATTRAVVEIRDLDDTYEPQGPLARRFDAFAQNKGAGLVTSGALTIGSSAVMLSQIGENPDAAASAGMLACFGLVHTFRGVATGLKDGVKKHAMDAAAFVSAVSAYLIINPELPAPVQLGYLSVAALAVYMGVRKQSAQGFKQPDAYFAATSYAAAALTDNANVALGFAAWASGYVSIDAMRKKGGVWQRVASMFGKGGGQPPSNDL